MVELVVVVQDLVLEAIHLEEVVAHLLTLLLEDLDQDHVLVLLDLVHDHDPDQHLNKFKKNWTLD